MDMLLLALFIGYVVVRATLVERGHQKLAVFAGIMALVLLLWFFLWL